MKKKSALMLFLLGISLASFSQKLSLNESTNFYEFSKVVKAKDSLIKDKFLKRFKAINLKNIKDQSTSITGKAETTLFSVGYPVPINYKVKIEFKENRYKLVLTNFVLTDQRGNGPLESLGSYKKRWIKKINKKLPEIISNIEKVNNKSEDW